MKAIPKERAWFGHDKNYKSYCFEERNDKYIDSIYNDFQLLSDITVNENNEIHSFNDQPALIFKNNFNKLCKSWFINGYNKRLNPEKPYLIIKGLCYYLNNEKRIGFEKLKENLK